MRWDKAHGEKNREQTSLETLKHIQNVIFKFTRRRDGAIIYTLYEGEVARKLGLTTETTYGKELKDVFLPHDAEYLLPFYVQALEGKKVSYEFTYAGRIFYNLLSPIIKNGVVVEAVGSAVDITKQKRVEEELKGARDRAEETSRFKSEFLAMMGHEIRTPMNGMISMLNMLLDTQLTDEQKKYVTIMNHSTQLLISLLNDILDYSKMEAGKMKLNLSNFNLTAAIEDAVKLMETKAYEKAVALQTLIDPSIQPFIEGDASRIRQVLLNLIDNAIKFTEQGKVEIRVRRLFSVPGWQTVLFEVKDSGMGIPEDIQDAIFQPFTQSDSSSTRKYGGTGLGLSIVKKLISLMNGTIEVTSSPGKGSIFSFTLRLKDSTAPSKSAAHHYSDQQGTIALLVEDNPINQEVISLQLQKLGWKLDIVKSGKEALAAVSQKEYAFILMDCQLPEMDGYETTKKIRAKETTKQQRTPIIAVTADAVDGGREICLAAGMDDYLAKPFRLEELSAILSKWANHKQAGQQTREGEYKQLASLFLEDTKKIIQNLYISIAHGDSAAILKLVHKAKSGCSFLGFHKLSASFKQLQDINCLIGKEQALLILSRIENEYCKAEAMLKNMQHYEEIYPLLFTSTMRE